MSRPVLAYGLLSIQLVVAVAGGSTAVLIGVLAVVLSSRDVTPGPAYADVPLAIIAMGGATALACLASAAAYVSQVAYDAQASKAARGERKAASIGLILHVLTFALMTCAYVGFAIGGALFIHFCITAASVLR